LTNNRIVAKRRLESLRKKVWKEPVLREFLVESLQELKELNYIEPAADNDVKSNQI